MFRRKKEGEKPYTQTEMEFLLGEARQSSFSKGFDAGRNSALGEAETLEDMYKLMLKRKQTMALKMVDAIANGRVERLLEEWDDKDSNWGDV